MTALTFRQGLHPRRRAGWRRGRAGGGGVAVSWRRVLAILRLSKTAICEESVSRDGWNDFHDYPDSTTPEPLHFHEHTCARCGKVFFI